MNADDVLFYLANALVAPIWLLMLLAPGAALTERAVRPLVAPLLVAVIYAATLVAYIDFGGGGPGDFFSLDGVASLFTDRSVVLIGWVHYLSFDLVVGSFIARDARRAGLGHAWVAPCLLLTLMYGPSGLLAWAAVRRLKTGRPLILS